MNHRRPSHDELTPDDLFRPEPSQGNIIPGEVVRSSDMPWNAPAQQQPEYFGEPPAAPYPAQQYPTPAPQYPTQYEPAGYGQQQQAYEAQQYVQQPVAADEASTQFMPPFPAAPQQHAQQQAPPPQQQQPQQYGGYQQGYGQQPPPPSGYQSVAAPAGAGSGRRFSPKAIGLAVVAGCAVLGIAVAAALSGGGDSASASAGGTHSASASSGASQSAGGQGADQGQAKALSQLLSTASNSRTAVVSAVGDIQHCQNLDQAAQDLSSAAGLRGQLVQQLAALQTDKLPGGGTELVSALREGWKASQSADSHYAAWARVSKSNCDHKHKPPSSDEKKAGDRASLTATAAKQKASRLWDDIAATTGLPRRSSTQL